MSSSRFKKPINLIFVLLIVTSLLGPVVVQASDEQAPPLQGKGIRTAVHDETGFLSFIGANPNAPINVPGAQTPGLSSGGRAMEIMNAYGAQFGLINPKQELQSVYQRATGYGRSTVKYQQTYEGIRVLGGELVVNMTDQGQLISISGEISPDLQISTQPKIKAGKARSNALSVVSKTYGISTSGLRASSAELWVFDERLLVPSTRPAELVWRVEVSATNGAPINELVLVNAEHGGISLHFNQVDTTWVGEETQVKEASESFDDDYTTPVVDVPPMEVIPKPTTTDYLQPINEAPLLVSSTWYVSTSGSDSNDCQTPTTPCATIGNGLGKANPGDTVYVTSGTWLGDGSVFPIFHLDKDINLSGGWDLSFSIQDGTSTIDGEDDQRPIHMSTGTSTIDHFTFINGFDINNGSGVNVKASGGNLTISNCTFKNNNAPLDGGAVYVEEGSVTIINSTFISNSAGSDGGAIASATDIMINNVTINGNTASTGGGVAVISGNFSLPHPFRF